MKSGQKLLEALQSLTPKPASGTAFRLTSVKYMTSPLSSEGLLTRGGCYNIRGMFAALYLADTPATALAEVQMLIAFPTITPHGVRSDLSPTTKTVVGDIRGNRSKLTDRRLIGVKGPPKVLVSIDFTLGSVLSLHDPQVQAVLKTNPSELNGEWLLRQQEGKIAPTQRLGKAAYQLETTQALWAPSGIEGGLNLVVFPDRLHEASSLRLYDPDGLLSLTLAE